MANIYINTLEATSTTTTTLNTTDLNIGGSISSSTLNISGSSIFGNTTTTNLIASNATISNLLVTGSSTLAVTTISTLQMNTDTGIRGADTIYYMVPGIAAAGSTTGQTGQVTLFTFSVPAVDTVYTVNGFIDVSARTSGTANIFMSYTSPGRNTVLSTSLLASMWGASGNTTTNMIQKGGFSLYTQSFLAKANTTILMGVSGTFVMTYTAKLLLLQTGI